MILKNIYSIIKQRQKELPKNSYCASLSKNGQDAILQKIGEETIELILASKKTSKKRVIEEVVDLWFHTLVLLVYKNISLKDIFCEFEKRQK